MALVRDLVRRGRRPAVLTRGYGRAGRAPLVVVGPDPGVDPRRAGDEPLELASRLPGVPVVVDADRVRGGREAVRLGAEVLILDDGFQHLRLERDLDLVVIDAGDPWGGGRMPPRGRLREPLTGLSRATAVVVSKLPADGDARLAAIRSEVERHAPGVPILGAHLVAHRLRTPDGVSQPARLHGQRVMAFAAVGRPEAFAGMLEDLGARVVGRRWFRDHHVLSAAELTGLHGEAKRRDAVLVTTAKDAVKLPPAADVWVLEVSLEPRSGSWDSLWTACPQVLG
jgi:tetraacyldisaccharide 4'-kinase